jgi:beta-phosphoglucomutase
VRPRAVVFDFNGTLSNDEAIMCEIFVELFAEHGKPLSAEEYFDQLAGYSDPEIVRKWLGRDHPALDAVVEERVARYRAAVSDGSTISDEVREAVRSAAERVPVAVVSGAARVEIEPVLEAAGLADLRALALLGRGRAAGEVLAFEDTEAGVVAAKAAGMRCVAVLGTVARDRLAQADEIVERIDARLIQRLLG